MSSCVTDTGPRNFFTIFMNATPVNWVTGKRWWIPDTGLPGAEAKKLVDAIAISWVDLGIPKFSRIIIQSPNSVYGFLARIAAERAGLISLTVYPYLRQLELEYMVKRTEATSVVIPNVYRNFDYLEMYKGLQDAVSTPAVYFPV